MSVPVAIAADTPDVGRPRVERFEDDALLRGAGRFIDDLQPVPHAWHAAIVRSQLAHARIASTRRPRSRCRCARRADGRRRRALSKPFPAAIDSPVAALRRGRRDRALRGRAARRRRRARPLRRRGRGRRSTAIRACSRAASGRSPRARRAAPAADQSVRPPRTAPAARGPRTAGRRGRPASRRCAAIAIATTRKPGVRESVRACSRPPRRAEPPRPPRGDRADGASPRGERLATARRRCAHGHLDLAHQLRGAPACGRAGGAGGSSPNRAADLLAGGELHPPRHRTHAAGIVRRVSPGSDAPAWADACASACSIRTACCAAVGTRRTEHNNLRVVRVARERLRERLVRSRVHGVEADERPPRFSSSVSDREVLAGHHLLDRRPDAARPHLDTHARGCRAAPRW